ncbi:MAG: Tryptophan synthase alpha chain [Labilithrix sp.]|nr:Tryptophan synthase alpha chain [Labilithrix sp.]
MFRRTAIVSLAATALALALGSEGCSHNDPLNIVTSPDAGAPVFTNVDAAPPEVDAGLTSYCPASTCPAPLATCPSSRFPCDVDLMSDPGNCGACGNVCPQLVANATFTCVAGKCAMKCRAESSFWTADCNGLVDDDCEVNLGTNDNCNGCGDTCPDPAKPCIFDRLTGKGQCGCPPGKLLCGSSCVDPSTDDQNCGQCGTACDPSDGDGGFATNGRFGCLGGECGHLKCSQGYGDCDNDLSTGCETNFVTTTNCGTCNNACAPGKTCGYNAQRQIECLCPTGQTLCFGRCVDVTTDPRSCGGCGIDCTTVAANQNNTVAFCTYGSCDYGCAQGWGDCDGDPKNGCEVNLNSDPKNCGSCGNSCNALAGQPCIAGQCAVEPCTEGPTK